MPIRRLGILMDNPSQRFQAWRTSRASVAYAVWQHIGSLHFSCKQTYVGRMSPACTSSEITRDVWAKGDPNSTWRKTKTYDTSTLARFTPDAGHTRSGKFLGKYLSRGKKRVTREVQKTLLAR